MSKRAQTKTKTAPTRATFGTPERIDVLRGKPITGESPAIQAGPGECQGKMSPTRRHFAKGEEFSQLSYASAQTSHSGSSATAEPAFGHNFGRVQLYGRVPQRIQAKTDVSQPEDEYEREADLAASRVTRSFLPLVPEGSLRPELSRSGPMIQRQAIEGQAPEISGVAATGSISAASTQTARETAAIGEAAPAGLIVEDDAREIGAGQMRKSEFLAELRSAVCTAADAELAAAGQSTQACPYLEKWFDYYSTRSGPQVERSIRKYAPETEGAQAARDYIPPVQERVRRGVATWAATGEITGVPEEMASQIPEAGALGAVEGLASGVAGEVEQGMSSVTSMLFKARPGGARESDPQAIRSQLGAGKPLDSSVKLRTESAFGDEFSRVRVHTDARAVELSAGLNARAFTIGSDIAFGRGEYQPGTLIGDAILAHELAHVVQQGGANPSKAAFKGDGAETASLEEDADVSAVGAVVSLWSGVKGALANVARNAIPHLRSGLKLQRCKTEERKKEKLPDPSKMTDAQIEATTEYKAYMDPALPWQTQHKMTKEEALLATRLIIRQKAEGKTVTFSADAETFMNLARKQLGTVKEAAGLKGKLQWVAVTPGMVEGQEPWTDFGKWLLAGGPEPDPTKGKVNCWEMVMFSAYKGGYTSRSRIEDIYNKGVKQNKPGTKIFPETIEKELRTGNEYVFKPGDPNSPEPLPGDIVIFTEAANHVAISLGTKDNNGEHKIISHWPPPDGSYNVKETTIEKLLAKMPAGNTIKFWSPAW